MPHRCNALIKLNNSLEKREKLENLCAVVHAHRLALIEHLAHKYCLVRNSIGYPPPALVGLVYEAPHWTLMSPPLGCVGPVPLEPAQTSPFRVVFPRAALKAGRDASFVICLVPNRAKSLTLSPYARLLNVLQSGKANISRDPAVRSEPNDPISG
jgi:hypothetical protein